MAKGVPILGKDPLGKAKYANVTESGDLKVQLSGTIPEVINYYNNQTVPSKNEGAPVTLQGRKSVLIQQRKCREGYTVPLVSLDGVTWSGITATNMDTGETTYKIFGIGEYVIDVRGWSYFRLDFVGTRSIRLDASIALLDVLPQPRQSKNFINRSSAKPDLTTVSAEVIPGRAQEMNPDMPGTLYYFTAANLWKSEDWGQTFNKKLFQHPTSEITGIYRNANGMIFVGAENGEIWRSDPNEENFELVLESVDGFMIGTMGFHCYRNLVLYSEYGPNMVPGENARRLWLSDDYGSAGSWRQIYEGLSQIEYHLHDVVFDPYENIIWLVAGDGENNANVYWSKDYGETMNQMFEYGTCPNHFTQIIPLPNCVLFLSDTRQVAVYRWDRPKTGIESQANPMIYLAHVFYTARQPNEYWARRAAWTVGPDATAYFGFAPYYTTADDPVSVYATYDGHEFYPIWTSKYAPGGTVSYSGIREVLGPSKDGYLAVHLLGRPELDDEGNHHQIVKIKTPTWIKDQEPMGGLLTEEGADLNG
jgi:hypothetical protein